MVTYRKETALAPGRPAGSPRNANGGAAHATPAARPRRTPTDVHAPCEKVVHRRMPGPFPATAWKLVPSAARRAAAEPSSLGDLLDRSEGCGCFSGGGRARAPHGRSDGHGRG